MLMTKTRSSCGQPAWSTNARWPRKRSRLFTFYFTLRDVILISMYSLFFLHLLLTRHLFSLSLSLRGGFKTNPLIIFIFGITTLVTAFARHLLVLALSSTGD